MRPGPTISVADIRTLDTLLGARISFMGCALGGIRKLQITLYVPLNVLTSIELQSTGWGAHQLGTSKTSGLESSKAAMWLRLGSSLARLNNLQILELWLDHNCKKYWWEFNEQAILSPLADLAQRSDVKVFVNLSRHAADDVPVPAFCIYRRLRQAHYAYEGRDGKLYVRQKTKYPILYGAAGHPEWEGIFEAEVDDIEREMWKAGLDVVDEICRPCCPPYNVQQRPRVF
jgi:hypothetical protein